jgi:flavin reductase (DIM6/NTAB) family NADH-FMN oxidoreductase RutF/DNA-binding IclR family transcriptional regulator
VSDAKIDSRELRNVFGSFVTGVTVITTLDTDGRPYGLTANSFSSVSLDPPLILWSQSLVSPSYPVFRDAERFAVSILSQHQTDLSSRFAKSSGDKFSGVETIEGIGGIPLINGASAYLECRKVTSYPGGDHAVFLGEVERMERSERSPLVFGGGKYMVAYPHDLGAFSIDLGIASIAHLHAVRIGNAAVAHLASELGTTTCLGVWGSHGPTIVRWEESSRPVAASLRTGVVLPVLRSAAGQIFGAFLPRELTAPFIEAELREAAPLAAPQSYQSPGEAEAALDFGDYIPPALGERMVQVDLKRAAQERRRELVITPGEAEARLARVRERKLARNIDLDPDGERENKVVAVSAPVFDKDGLVVLAITALGYAHEFDAGGDTSFAKAVQHCASDLSQRLGYRM